MADQHHQLIKHLMTTKPWDFFMHVDMGVDRIHHGFWKYFDERHPLYEPGNPYENAIRDYYIHLDRPDRRAAGSARRRHGGAGCL